MSSLQCEEEQWRPAVRVSSSEQLELLLRTFKQHDHHRAWFRLLNAVLRGATTGFCLRGGLHLVSFLVRLAANFRRRQARKSLNFLDKLHDTLRYTAFLGAFGGIFVSVDEGIAAAFGKRKTAGWRAFAAGTAAGPSLLLTGPKNRHTSLALYILLRGLTLLVRCGNKTSAHPWVHRALGPTRWRHGDTALMCLSTSQIGYSWIMMPWTLPPSYVSFLNKHGGKPHYLYRAAQELSLRNSAGQPPGRLQALQGTRHAAYTGSQVCPILHPGRGCEQHAWVDFLPRAYCRALPVYLPVYVLPAILVHRKHLISGETAPLIWAKVARGAARSSLFLALYCTLAWRGACVGFQTTGRATGAIIAGSCWTGGLAALVEKKSRRMELAIYCLSRAIESFALCLASWGWVKSNRLPKRIDVLMFSLATAAIMHCYSGSQGRHRDVFRSKYLNVLDFIFGSQGVKEGSIKHSPSTAELLAHLEARMPVQAATLRRRTGSFLGSLENLQSLAHADEDETDSPRSLASDSGVTSFRLIQQRLSAERQRASTDSERP